MQVQGSPKIRLMPTAAHLVFEQLSVQRWTTELGMQAGDQPSAIISFVRWT